MSSDWEFWGAVVVMYGVSIPVSFTGVSIAVSVLAGLITALVALVGVYWLRGIPPMDYLWHGWDDSDVTPILDGGGESR